jgi:hypothetical protein
VILILALGVSACVFLPLAALVALARLGYVLWQGRRLDRSGGAR